jgi:general secretion pathway protein I
LFRSTNHDGQCSDSGFTLIEALVALIVIAISLGVIGPLVAANVRGSAAVDQRLSLLSTARAILAGLPDRGQLTLGESTGELAGNRWRLDVLPFQADFVDPTRPNRWVPRALVIRVQSPDGQILRVDTARLTHADGSTQ